ncbi:phage tail assembly chaperone [Bordetella bronchiseptica]|uniref:phage tail assembly chaperone n=1 Tax=Bordetella bronchiseptica TaxID=518 RepID=UPI00045B8283|nr:phage tail assembly chaperone [Bordetella bronchiseptica]KAK50442.1 phage tail assembly chaperone [Bordetella bronchiseptica OSU054]
MKSTNQAIAATLAVALNPLSGFRHETVPVPGWGTDVVVRAPSPSDHLFHAQALRLAAGIEAGVDDQEIIESKLRAPGTDYTRASAALFVRTVFVQTEAGPRRLCQDENLDEVAAAFGPIHAQLVAKALELGNLIEGAAETAKKPSRKRRTSAS